MQAVSATYTTAHGNAGSLTQLSKTRDRTHNPMAPSWIHDPLRYDRNYDNKVFKEIVDNIFMTLE